MTRSRSLLILACSLVALLTSSYRATSDEYDSHTVSTTSVSQSVQSSSETPDKRAELLSLAQTNVLAAVASLKVAADDGMTDCHSVAHKVGSLGYISESASLASIVAAGTDTCLGGVMHGALEEFAKTASEVSFTRDIKTACAEVSDSYEGSCTHGAGHAIAVRIPEDHRAAVQACMLFGEEMLSTNCAAGVLMAYIDDRTENSQYKALRGKPSDVCSVFNGPYRSECWRKSFKLMTGSSVKEIFDECLRSPDPADCDRYVGVRMVSEYARPDIKSAADKAYSECAKSSNPDDCKLGVVWSAANESRARGTTKEQYSSLCVKYNSLAGCGDEEKAVFFD